MPSPTTERLVWIDCEMTGLDPSRDELVEVAVIVTDYDLTPVHPGFSTVIAPTLEALAGMGDFVRSMHTQSGLLAELDRGIPLADAELHTLAYIMEHAPAPQAAPLAGNSVGTDRVFLQKYMPQVAAHLHYRNVDVSTIKELAKHWLPPVYFHAPEKNGGHRALADIQESIRELRYYRLAAMREEPPGSSDVLKAIAAELIEKGEAGL